MTREEAIIEMQRMKKAYCDTHTDAQLKKDNKIIEALDMGIKALEQESILDKIRAEIESCQEDTEPHLCDYRYYRNEGLNMALDIVDKYRTGR